MPTCAPAGLPPLAPCDRLAREPTGSVLSAQTALVAPVLQMPDVLEAGFCAVLVRHLETDSLHCG